MSASPICQVKSGAGAYASTTNGINAAAGSTVVINLVSSAGVNTWSIACVYADDLSSVATVNASLVIDPVGKTATFTAPVAGRGYIFQSQVNGGVLLTGNPGATDPTATTTFGIWVLTSGGARVLIPNETIESSATSGWVADVNTLIRNPSSGGTTPTGTGIPHVVGGVQQAAASYIVNGDVDNAAGIALSKLAAPTGSGFVTVTGGAWDAAALAQPLSVAKGGTGLASLPGSTGNLLYNNAGALAATSRFVFDATAFPLVTGNGTSMYLGTDTSFTSQASIVSLYAAGAGAIGIGLGSTTYQYFIGGRIENWQTIVGSVVGSTAMKYGTVSVTTAATTTLTGGQYCYPMITLAAGASAAFTVVLPLTQGAAFDVYNATAFTATIGGSSGATITCAAGAKVRAICPDGANYR